AADGTGAGTGLADLRMHRARVDGAFDGRLRRARAQVFLRIADEFRAAAGRAEIIGMAAVRGAMFRRMRVDRHAADGINDAASGVVVVLMLGRHGRLPCPIYPWGVYRP